MKIIGIVTRKYISDENHDIDIVYNDIVLKIKQCGAIPIGIILEEDYKEIIDICDAVVFQGGDSFEKYDLEALQYIYDNNIPVLGICLGMQLMGVLFGGKLIDIENHKNLDNKTHIVKISTNTRLYDILNEEIIYVNTRHKSVVKDTKLTISALSSEGYIEAIEDSNKKFFVGVQWHPENMNNDKLFKCLIAAVNK